MFRTCWHRQTAGAYGSKIVANLYDELGHGEVAKYGNPGFDSAPQIVLVDIRPKDKVVTLVDVYIGREFMKGRGKIIEEWANGSTECQTNL